MRECMRVYVQYIYVYTYMYISELTCIYNEIYAVGTYMATFILTVLYKIGACGSRCDLHVLYMDIQ
jgi:hypothetical protein